jgi:hypothetical protein
VALARVRFAQDKVADGHVARQSGVDHLMRAAGIDHPATRRAEQLVAVSPPAVE